MPNLNLRRDEKQFRADCVKLHKNQGTEGDLHVHKSLRSTTVDPIMYEDMYGEHYPQSEQRVEWMIVPFWEEMRIFEKKLKRTRLYYDTAGELNNLIFRARMFLRRLRWNNKLGKFFCRVWWHARRQIQNHIHMGN